MTRSRSSTVRWTLESTSSTPPMATPPASQKRSWARHSRADGATMWCSPLSSAFLSARTRTAAGHPVGGSPKRSRARCGAFRPTGSTSTRWGCDPDTDIDETLSALSDLVHAGKIRSFGTSKVPASAIVEAQWTAERRGHERFRAEQPPYSLLTRAIEYDVRRRDRVDPHPDGNRVRHPSPGGHLRDHRPAHHGTPGFLPRCRRDRTARRSARPHRPDR